jgi:hypothetical protein
MRVVLGVLRTLGFVVARAFSVRFLYGLAEAGHVRAASGGPAVGGDVSDSGGDEHGALLPWGNAPATRVLLRISRFHRSIMVLVRMRRRLCFVKLLSADMACLVVRLSGWF